MKIEAVDFFYLSTPEVLDIGDGSQDLLLLRLEARGRLGWGECEASPLTSIASLVCPMSHSACKPVRASILGQRLNNVADIARITDLVRENSQDLLQADHTFSGIEIAMWDLLGRVQDAPVYELLGYRQAYPKMPYASQLFGASAHETLQKALSIREQGYQAAKFGWGPFGTGSVDEDAEQVAAAREGLGKDATLLIDAGTVWKEDVDAASARLPILQDYAVTWLEEPFVSGAHAAYRRLVSRSRAVKLAGGEGSHHPHMAEHMIDHAGLSYIQIDAGRIGGIGSAKRGVTYVNHTFTSHLALSASLQPYAGLEDDVLCEYPVEPSPLAVEVTREQLLPGQDGLIRVPEAPGMGVTPDLGEAARYLIEVEIRVGGKILYTTPHLGVRV